MKLRIHVCITHWYRSSVSNDNIGDDDGGDDADAGCHSNSDHVATDTCSCYDDDVNNFKLAETLRLLSETHRMLLQVKTPSSGRYCHCMADLCNLHVQLSLHFEFINCERRIS